MNTKTTIGLVIALAIAVVALWWAQSSSVVEKPKETAAEAKRLLDPPLDELRGFEVKTGVQPAIVFELRDGKWQMTAPLAWPGEHGLISEDANRIKDLKYVHAYAKDDPDRPTSEMSSLESPLKIVKLTGADGKSFVVKIGARQALSKKTYVQREGDDRIFLADTDLNEEMRKGLAEYRSKRIADFNQLDAVRVELSGDHQYTLVKTDGKWTLDAPVKGRADAAKIGNMLRTLAGLSANKFIEDSPRTLRPYGLENPRLRVAVTVETKTPKPAPETTQPATAPAQPEYDVKTQIVRLAFGGGADKQVFAKIDQEDRPAVFDLPEDSVTQAAPPLSDLRDKKVVDVQTPRIQRIVVTSAGGPVELTKAGNTWQMSTGTASEPPMPAEFAAVDDFLKAIRELTATGFEETELPTFGFGDPRAAIELGVEGQLEPERFSIGGLTASKTGAYLRNDRDGFIAVVKAESAEPLIVRATSFMSRDLLKFTGAMAARLELTRQGVPCTLAREAGEWKFTAPVAGKAEAAAVNNVVTDLSNLRGRQVVGRAADLAKFGLDAATAMIRVTVDTPPLVVKKPGAQPATQPSSQPTTEPAATQPAEETESIPQPPVAYTVFLARHEGKVYAMTDGGTTICEVDAKVLDDIEAELFDSRVFVANAADSRRLEFSGAANFAFQKTGSDWTLVGEPSFQTDATKITDLLNALRDLKTKRYLKYAGGNPKDYGLDQPAIIVGIETDAGPTALSISSMGPQGGDRYASAAVAPDRVFVLSAEDVGKFNKQVQDFRK
jgi:hypothetical protein